MTPSFLWSFHIEPQPIPRWFTDSEPQNTIPVSGFVLQYYYEVKSVNLEVVF